jgi:protein involved in polysaccharide export with SLBB domain
MNIKRFFSVLCLLAFSAIAMAQSSADVERAKQIVRSQGYSESQIAAAAGMIAGGGSTMSKSAEVAITTSDVVDRNTAYYEVAAMPVVNVTEVVSDGTGIFGHNLFKSKNLNFIPSYNVPTPENYKLSAGDEIVIDIWGDVISNITTKISPEGSVNIPNLGPVYISGQTVAQAEKSIKSYLSKIYSGLAQEEPTTFAKLALGKTKTVTINVVGDVAQPGSYTLPSLSTVASAMYLAGGPSEIGTVRNIKLYRNNKLVSTLDAYEFILNGKFDTNLRLEDNDVIIVTPYESVVSLGGAVKRPMKFETKEGETVADVLNYAGGFSDQAYVGQVHIARVLGRGNSVSGATRESFDVPASEFAKFKVCNGDVITVNRNSNRYKNRVKIAGAVWRPGTYSLDNSKSVKDLIKLAGGLTEDAHTDKGFIVRFDEKRNKEQVSFNVSDVILGARNIELLPDDSVQIFSINTLQPEQTVTIYGEVQNPGKSFEFRRGMTIGDIILMSGGLTNAATLSKVEVARRITKQDGSEDIATGDEIAKIMFFNLLKNPADSDVELEPFDIVFVRKSASYKPQQTISVQGEVNYPGEYVVEKNVVRLSDIINRAQGFNKDAYVKGAKLTRTLTKEEFERLSVAKEIAKKQVEDSLYVEEMVIGESYTVAIDLEKAMANPGSVADVVLRTGDVISVPQYNSTVKISGAVLYPNVVAYEPGKSWDYYISNAGGVTDQGKKGGTYMVHMNGSVASKGKKGFEVQPGTEIIVPTKDTKDKGQNLASIIGIATSTASLAAMVTTIINQTK